MRTVDLIQCVRDGTPVPAEALRTFVAGVTRRDIPDYQASAFLMAVFFQGLSDELTTALTLAMRDSGSRVDLSHIPQPKVDKHSTGGVGDKISIALAPLVATCGVAVPMVSGRGLGHTGGTLDKLEAIAGFAVKLDLARFRAQVAALGTCFIGQTNDIAPADRALYALRDATATVASIPLITASILAKKLAEGIDGLVLDVKVGRAALMQNEADARQLASALMRVGTDAGLRVRALLTRMDEPLGKTIGNGLETREAIEILRGEGPQDTTALTLELGAEMLHLGGVAATLDEARVTLRRAIDSGAGAQKLAEVIAAQGGDPSVVEHPERLPHGPRQTPVLSEAAGVVTAIDGRALGMASMQLGAGRATAADAIHPGVGLALCVQRSDSVHRGDVLAIVHHDADLDPTLRTAIAAAFTLGSEAPPPEPLVRARLGA